MIASALSLVLAAPNAAPLEPVTPWGSYDEGYRCMVERTFGAAPGGTFAMKLGYSPFDMPEDAVFVARTARALKPKDTMAVSFDNGPPITLKVVMVSVEPAGVTVFRVDSLSRAFWSGFRLARTMRVSVGSTVIADLRFTGVEKAVSAAEGCAKALYVKLGGDPAGPAKSALSTSDTAGPRMFKANFDPAISARMAGRSAILRLMIGVDGRVQDCKAIKSSGAKDADDALCRLMSQSAMFQPARRDDGTPYASLYRARMKFGPSPASYARGGDQFVDGFIGAGQPAGTVN